MNTDKARTLLVEMAYAIIDMHEENLRLRFKEEEAKEYRQKYNDSLQDSINHSRNILGSMVHALIDPDSPISIGLQEKNKTLDHE